MENLARPKTELSWLTLRNCKGKFDNDKLEEYIKREKRTNKYFNLNEKDSDVGFTAVHWAVSESNLKAIEILVQYGANIHIKDTLGFTPLFYSTGQFPNTEIIRYLVEKCHANINEVSLTGNTCLHGAAFNGNIDAVKLLLKYGANPKACNEEGTTPFDLASKHSSVLDLLHAANSKVDSFVDKQGEGCTSCGKVGKLRRCSRCQVTFYCGKDCQKNDWKSGNHRLECEEGVIAEPCQISGYHMTVMSVLAAKKPTIAVYGGETEEYLKSKKVPGGRFVVKVQLPLPPFSVSELDNKTGLDGAMMVYNVDRSVDVFIKKDAKGSHKIMKKIIEEGVMGLKGYFWAVQVPGRENVIKVFPGKLAPVQNW